MYNILQMRHEKETLTSEEAANNRFVYFSYGIASSLLGVSVGLIEATNGNKLVGGLAAVGGFALAAVNFNKGVHSVPVLPQEFISQEQPTDTAEIYQFPDQVPHAEES